MIPKDKVKEILLKHELLEKELSSVNVEPKKYALKSKEYSSLGNILQIAKEYLNYEIEKKDLENIIDDKIFFTKASIDNFNIFSILRIYSGNKTIFGAEQLPS